MATLSTGMTARQRSTEVSLEGKPVAGSMRLTFTGNGIVTRTRPFSTRFEKSLAFSPFTRKSSASIGRNNGSSAFLFRDRFAISASKRALATSGESWKLSEGM